LETTYYIDAVNEKLEFSCIPNKIICLVPSITSYLHAIGINNEVVGITKFCIHPNIWYQQKQKIGGTKDIQIEKIKLLQPDLVIASKEENVLNQIKAIRDFSQVYTTDITNISSALDTLTQLGKIVGKEKEATTLVQSIEISLSSFKPTAFFSCIYLIWKKPYYTIGGDTYINDILLKMGLHNLFQSHTRYPEVTIETMIALKPDVILLSSEPYPFKEKHIKELSDYLPNTKIILVDGEIFSWYGNKMLEIKAYYNQLLSEL
jgi:ABC-type Fe3+-hydroxamate transport system substrate-binding protein